jgi:hypothetical protein
LVLGGRFEFQRDSRHIQTALGLSGRT